MIKYIGDISKNDALVLQEMAKAHTKMLEFGCGASTQILTKYKPQNHIFVSIDTSWEWINKTMQNLELFGLSFIGDQVHFRSWDEFLSREPENAPYDFIFDDGVDHLRREFAIKIWPHLKVGGVLAFHDTRRAPDFRNVLEVLAHFQDEIGKVEFNYKSSNITLVYKKEAEPWTNWQIDEKKEPWMLGYGAPPQEFIDSLNLKNEI